MATRHHPVGEGRAAVETAAALARLCAVLAAEHALRRGMPVEDLLDGMALAFLAQV